MKLCVLRSKIDAVPIFEYFDVFLYHIPVTEYKKCILKGIVYSNEKMVLRASFAYASDILKGRFTLCEEIISKDAYYSYWYAITVIKGRFELGEESISKDIGHSFGYAVDVIKERFILAEEMIKQSVYCQDYEHYFNIKL